MKEFRWSFSKNAFLVRERGVSFETIVHAIRGGGVIDVTIHPDQARYGGQKLLYIRLGDHVWVVPHREDKDSVVLITAYPSRKATKVYLEK